MTRREWVVLAGAAAVCAAGWFVLSASLDAGDARRKAVRTIRREADAAHDLLVFTDEAPELVALAAPLPAVSNLPLAPPDLTGFRRLYVIAPGEGALAGYEARLGVPSATFAPAAARRWDLVASGLATVRLDLQTHLTDGTVTARREGGQHNGTCERTDAMLRCQSTDDWNHVRVDDHPIGGVNVRCIFAHPQADGRLVIEVPHTPPARALVGMVGIDDRAFFPTGAAVTNDVRFTPADGHAATNTRVIAPNRIGATPYRVELGGRAGALSFTISTPNAGARSYCFSAYLTE